jgi:hypothetical protein
MKNEHTSVVRNGDRTQYGAVCTKYYTNVSVRPAACFVFGTTALSCIKSGTGGLQWKLYVALRRRKPPSGLHGVTAQTTTNRTSADVTISNPNMLNTFSTCGQSTFLESNECGESALDELNTVWQGWPDFWTQ